MRALLRIVHSAQRDGDASSLQVIVRPPVLFGAHSTVHGTLFTFVWQFWMFSWVLENLTQRSTIGNFSVRLLGILVISDNEMQLHNHNKHYSVAALLPVSDPVIVMFLYKNILYYQSYYYYITLYYILFQYRLSLIPFQYARVRIEHW